MNVKTLLLCGLVLASGCSSDCSNQYEMSDGTFCKHEQWGKYYGCDNGREYLRPEYIKRVSFCYDKKGEVQIGTW